MDPEEKNKLMGSVEIIDLTDLKGMSDTTMAADYSAGTYKISDYQINVNDISTLSINEIDLSSIAAGQTFGLNAGAGANGWTTMPNTIGAVGSHTYTTTTTGTGGYNWNNVTSPTTISANGQMELRGDNADIKINDVSLSDWMKTVEQRLNILRPNPKLEAEWDELRELGERYRELEKQCQEKAKMWNKLKSMPPVPTK